MSEKELMKFDMVQELCALLIEYAPNMSMEEAMSVVFNSEVYQKLQDDATRLYYQSPRYVFSFLLSELKMGKIA